MRDAFVHVAFLSAFIAFSVAVPAALSRDQIAVTVCNNQSDACANGGTCMTAPEGSNNLFACFCPHGFQGPRCEKRINFCEEEEQFCLNEGKCEHDPVLGTACNCKPGFGGQRCEVMFDLCKEGYCLNGGVCTLKNKCWCVDGFAGSRCEVEVPRLYNYNVSGCPTPDFCQQHYRDGICNGECNNDNCFNDGFDCEIGGSGLHKYLEKCTHAFRNGVDLDKAANENASGLSQKNNWSVWISGAAFLTVVIFIIGVILNGRRKYGNRQQAQLFKLLGGSDRPYFETTTIEAQSPPKIDNPKTIVNIKVEEKDADSSESDIRAPKRSLAPPAPVPTTPSYDTILKAVYDNKTVGVKKAIEVASRWGTASLKELAKHVNAVDTNGMSAIHHAVMYNNVAVVHELLATGCCDVYATNKCGQNALLAAANANHGNNMIVRMLLTYMVGDPPNTQNPELTPQTKKGTREYLHVPATPVKHDFRKFTDSLGRSAMHYAAINGNASLISELALSGFSVNATCNMEETPLFLAVRGNHTEAVKLLLTLGAKATALNSSGFSPLKVAKAGGNDEIVKLLGSGEVDLKHES